MTWGVTCSVPRPGASWLMVVLVCMSGWLSVSAAAPRYVGTNSCAAANCHGGDGTGPRWSSSYSDWIQRDSHSRSYSVLLGDRSRRMVAALGYPSPAHQSTECLNCHALPPTSDGSSEHHRHLATDGVSCEACHGPASLWIASHVRRDWSNRKAVEGRGLGFKDTADLRVRARVCTGCHVGGPDRDVNHDLIAAGHPRLHFEMSAYHANLPRHWNDIADGKRHAGRPERADGTLRELKLWALGQVETFRARAQLSSWRASTPKAPWPELSETRCFACHHDLRDARWRRATAKRSGRRPGQFPAWAGWERSMIGSWSVFGSAGSGPRLVQALKRVDDATRPLVPDRARMRLETEALIDQLDQLSLALNQHEFTVEDLDRLGHRLLSGTGGQSGPGDWDQAAQLYLALSSLQVGQKQATGMRDDRRRLLDRALERALPRMRAALSFPDGHDSAAQFRGGSAPVNQSPQALQRFDEATSWIRSVLKDHGEDR